jgi:hypothetical protein
MYIAEEKLFYSAVEGFWSDAGTFDSLMKAALWRAEKAKEGV